MHYVNIRDGDSNYLSFKLTNKLYILISVELENVFCNYLVTLIKIPSAPEGGSANTSMPCICLFHELNKEFWSTIYLKQSCQSRRANLNIQWVQKVSRLTTLLYLIILLFNNYSFVKCVRKYMYSKSSIEAATL